MRKSWHVYVLLIVVQLILFALVWSLQQLPANVQLPIFAALAGIAGITALIFAILLAKRGHNAWRSGSRKLAGLLFMLVALVAPTAIGMLAIAISLL